MRIFKIGNSHQAWVPHPEDEKLLEELLQKAEADPKFAVVTNFPLVVELVDDP